jgi:hypothetical protein
VVAFSNEIAASPMTILPSTKENSIPPKVHSVLSPSLVYVNRLLPVPVAPLPPPDTRDGLTMIEPDDDLPENVRSFTAMRKGPMSLMP